MNPANNPGQAPIDYRELINRMISRATQQLYQPITPIAKNTVDMADLNELGMHRSKYEDKDKEDFPSEMRNTSQGICKLYIRAVENYQLAYKGYSKILNMQMSHVLSKQKDRTKLQQQLNKEYKNYDKESYYRAFDAFLSNKSLIIKTGGKNQSKIKIGKYSHFIIQSKQQYNQLLTYVINQVQKIKITYTKTHKKKTGFFNFFSSNDDGKLPEQELDKIKQTYFMLLQIWSTLDWQYRIICIYDEKLKNTPGANFCIYFNDQADDEQKSLLSPEIAKKLVQKLTLAHITDRNRDNIEKINERYLRNCQKQLKQKIRVYNSLIPSLIEYVEEQPPLGHDLNNSQHMFNDYDYQIYQNLIKKWKQKSEKQKKNSQTFWFLQPEFIRLPKSWPVKNITLFVSSQSEEKFHFNYKQQKDQSLIFQLDQDQRKLPYAYHGFPKKKRKLRLSLKAIIEFDEEAKKKSSRNDQQIFDKKITMENNFQMSPNSNQQLGLSYEVALYPNEKIKEEAFTGNFPYTLEFQILLINTTAKKAENFDIPLFRKVNLLQKMGKIPNMYSRYFKIDYNPNNFQQVSQIFQGKELPLDQQSFQLTYLKFAKFFERQESISQNYCDYLSRKKNIEQNQSGYTIENRYKNYYNKIETTYKEVQKKWNEIKNNLQHGVNLSKIIKSKYINMMKSDVDRFSSPHRKFLADILEKYIIYCHYFNKDQREADKIYYCSSLVGIADRVMEIINRASYLQFRNSSYIHPDQVFIFFTAFIIKLFPYHSLRNLQKDLYQVRFITQKLLPQFNRTLNRKGIGLENYCSQHFLKLFTNLPMELCYRIWDFFMKGLSSQMTLFDQSRITVMYTLMIFQQKSFLLPIYPINIFIQAVHTNLAKIKINKTSAYHFSQNMERFSEKRYRRREKVQALAKQRYLKLFIFGKNPKSVQLLDQDVYDKKLEYRKFSLSSASRQKDFSQQKIQKKLLSISELSYPLPRPNHPGFKIRKVCVFVSGVFLLKRVDFQRKKYYLITQITNINKENPEFKVSYKFEDSILDKNVFLNRYYFGDIPEDKEPCEKIYFRIMEEDRKNQQSSVCILQKNVYFSNYHKNTIYKESMTFDENQQFGQRTNLGTSVINFSLVLQSEQKEEFDEELFEEVDKREDQFFQKMLDYDISPENNPIIKEMKSLDKTFKKILDPLDELDEQKFLTLRMATSFKQFQAEWIRNSKVSVEEMKAIFNYIFLKEDQKELKLSYPHFYEEFAQGLHKFDLGKFLFELILSTPINITRKLNLIYCLTVHYQNISHGSTNQEMTTQTLNSIIREILVNYGMLNACPFSRKFFGEIVSGCFYSKGDKVEERKKDITHILQDWAYLCQIKSKYGGMILGTMDELMILRSMLPAFVQKDLQQTKFCRFEIVYRKGQGFYIWSATVKTKDFSVVQRGVKFLNSFPQYRQVRQKLSSMAQSLYNCQHIIPLQDCRSISYQQFLAIFKQQPLLNYLLNQELPNSRPWNQQQSKQQTYKLQFMQDLQGWSQLDYTKGNYDDQLENYQNYTDFALYRHQNCFPYWKRCQVQQVGEKQGDQVIFQGIAGKYKVSAFELIDLSQNLRFQDRQPEESSMIS